MAGCNKSLLDADGCVPLKFLMNEVTRLRQMLANVPRLHRKDILRRYGISKSTLHRRIRAGTFPKPVRITGPVWRLVDLELAEITGRIARPDST
jgi:predicted DNA-binding transcriptional regulator AlpA